jgi:dienelactone hydrolase
MSIKAPPPSGDQAIRARRWGHPGTALLRHPQPSAAVAALVAVPATAVGAGIGIRHLVVAGIGMAAVVGLALLALGVALLCFSAMTFWRLTRRWQRVWLVPLTLVALFVMVPVAIGTMLGFAPRARSESLTPADRGLAYRNVTFSTSDAVRLSAWYLPSRNRAAIVTLPGSGSTRTATLRQATVLAEHGYGVLLVDPRGQGDSGGRAMDAGWYGDRDVAAAVGFLQRQPEVRPSSIGVLGLSMGGEEAIGAAGGDRRIRAVVAEGATHRTAADKAGWLPGGLTGALQRDMDRITYGVAALFTSAPVPGTLRESIKTSGGTQFLLIAAGRGVDEPEVAAYLRAAAPDRVQVWNVPGASHTHGLAQAPQEWSRHVLGFLDAALDVSR